MIDIKDVLPAIAAELAGRIDWRGLDSRRAEIAIAKANERALAIATDLIHRANGKVWSEESYQYISVALPTSKELEEKYNLERKEEAERKAKDKKAKRGNRNEDRAETGLS